ncbi:MAG: tetratricopeptide repeat protein, partial [Ignavibacteria bacterium]|nr:tetratricopeptide repeat protein [Ignavibacteria bacterium]
MRYLKLSIILFFVAGIFIGGCNYTTVRTYERPSEKDVEEDPQPNYDVSLDEDYQDYVSFMFMGNRNENFSTYFNTYFMASSDFDDAITLYRTSTVASFNRRLDSLNITPPVSGEIKDKLTKVIERASKVIQLHKNSKFLDDAVLLIGKSYFYLGDYLQAERKFNEFLTNLSASDLYDEAMYYLGVTKMKLRKTEEASTILKNQVSTAKDKEVRSEAAAELGIDAFGKKNYKDAIDYFRKSIEYTSDNENKALKQFILARIYSLYAPTQAAKEFYKVLDYSSDFDLAFYAKLNYGKSLDKERQFSKAYEELDNLRRKYREVPEYKQLTELELANNLYEQKKYKQAIEGYFDVIIDYPASVAASDAYYYLANHYETI